MTTPRTETAKNAKGVEFKAGDSVVFRTGSHRGAQSLTFSITHFVVREHTLYGKKTGESTYVYGLCPDGVGFGGCLLSEVVKVGVPSCEGGK